MKLAPSFSTIVSPFITQTTEVLSSPSETSIYDSDFALIGLDENLTGYNY